MILLTVGIVRAQANQQGDLGTAISHVSQKSTVGMAQIARLAQKAAILPFTSTPRASILFNVLLGKIPPSIPVLSSFPDATGVISTYTPKGAISTNNNSFFSSSITTNGRSCLTCHVPQSGWEISPPQIQTIYAATSGRAPLFQPIDSANCPNTPGASSPTSVQFFQAHSQLFSRGNIRIAINAPTKAGQTTFDGNANPEWVMTVLNDPTGCENDPSFGLPAGLASVYRRPLPSANVGFLNPGAAPGFNIMWDAREPDLPTQFIDAVEFHGQNPNFHNSNQAPTLSTQGADFQQGLFTAQSLDLLAGDLTGGDHSGATGGPQNLFNAALNVPPNGGNPGQPGCFTPETLDTFNGSINNFCPGNFDPTGNVFPQYTAFLNPSGNTPPSEIAQRESIARGETIFNTRQFTIDNVTGFNDVPGACGGNPNAQNPCGSQTCSSCHNNVNVGNDNFLDPKREGGIMDNALTGTPNGDNQNPPPIPPSSDFPLFAFYCPSGSIPFFSNPVTSQLCPGGGTCDQFQTTDPGVGLIDGKCADLGKMKVPVLRGLASRAPFFHGGNAMTMQDLVSFYNTRFNIGLNGQEQTDLVNFLNSL